MYRSTVLLHSMLNLGSHHCVGQLLGAINNIQLGQAGAFNPIVTVLA